MSWTRRQHEAFWKYRYALERVIDKGSPTLPKQSNGEHDALADARWNQEAYALLQSSEHKRPDRSADQ